MTDVPTTAATDLGATDWERRLIRELRSRHYQWRTEQTYRGWAGRFAKWLEGRPPVGTSRRLVRNSDDGRAGGSPLPPTIESATGDDVRDFLTDLATRQRVSASTQKQALNALVFFLREALERDPGEFGDFARARKIERLPVVLTRDECRAPRRAEQAGHATRAPAFLRHAFIGYSHRVRTPRSQGCRDDANLYARPESPRLAVRSRRMGEAVRHGCRLS